MRNVLAPRAGWYIAVGAILALALGLRLFGHNWDDGWYLHPDERFIAIVVSDRIHVPSAGDLSVIFDPARSPLNPRADDADGRPQSFAYGSLPLYVVAIVGWFAGHLTGVDYHAYRNVAAVGRPLTALLDTATVLLAMAFAARVYGRAVAALTGILLATSVILIQLAHFFTTDTWITFFAVATLFAALRLWETRRLGWAMVAGAAVGAGLATKVSVVTLLVPVLVAALAPEGRPRRPFVERSGVIRLGAAAVAALLVFAVFEPYALWRPGPFIEDALTQWEIVSGRFDVPFTRQFVGTTRGVYQIDNLVRWGLGPLLGLAAIAGTLAAIRRTLRHRSPGDILLVTWVVTYFALVATAEAKFLRYMAPIVPALVILAAAWLTDLASRHELHRWRRAVTWCLVGLVVLGTAAWALAFEAIYTQTHPRVAASEWIYRNIPPGATLTAEYWDDALPIPVTGQPPDTYRTLTLDLYADRHNESAFAYLVDQLAQADYIVLSSDRLSASIPRLPWRYPVYKQYYHLLDNGQLGFQLVYHGTNYPRLGPVTIVDEAADESFRVYDHPEVRIYKKVERLSTEELRDRFAWALAQPWWPTRERPDAYLLDGMPPGQRQAAQDLGWSARLTRNSVAATVVWLIALALLGLATLPATLLLLRAFPDLGWGLARTVGLVAVGYLVWIGASLGVSRFTLPWIIVAVVLTAFASWGGLRGQLPPLLYEVRRRRPVIIASELAFLVGFGFFLFLRSLNPDLWHTYWGGEKPMEMAYISAIGRSATFPPYDPWFAGGVMNYYYYGFYLMALLWKLTGVPPEIGFQLAAATLAGLVTAAAFSLSAALCSRALRLEHPRAIVSCGVLGTVLLVAMGNLDAVGQIVATRSLRVDYWQSSRVVDYAITEFPYFSLLWADVHPHLLALPVMLLLLALLYAWLLRPPDTRGGFWPWLWSGAAALTGGSIAVINSWDLPLTVLFTGAVLVTAALRNKRRPWRTVGFAVLQCAALVIVARWLFEPFFSRFVVLVSGVARTTEGTALPQYLVHFGPFLGIVALAGLTFAVRHYAVRAAAHDSAPVDMFVVLTTVVAALAGYTIVVLVLGPLRWLSIGGIAISLFGAAVMGFGVPLVSCGSLTAIRPVLPLLAVVAGGLAPVRPTAAVLIPALAVSAALWVRLRDRPGAGMAALALAAAVGIGFGVDLVYVVDDLSGSDWARMNTVFKFYFESWPLYALAATVAMAWLIRAVLSGTVSSPIGLIAHPKARGRPQRGVEHTVQVLVARAALAGAVVLVLAGLAYPIFATRTRLAEHMPGSPTTPTLDGLAWMRGSWIFNAAGQPIDFSGDYDAIRWLREHTQGLPVILEASIGPYRGNGSRIAAATGLPDVLGWDRHQRQQRPWPEIDERLLDVRRIYTSTDVNEKRALLHRYGVRYIIVGDVERHTIIQAPFAGATQPAEPYASPEGLAAFDQMLGTDLRLVFESGNTRIYEVLPVPSLPPLASRGAS